jgi:hypothetical protein
LARVHAQQLRASRLRAILMPQAVCGNGHISTLYADVSCRSAPRKRACHYLRSEGTLLAVYLLMGEIADPRSVLAWVQVIAGSSLPPGSAQATESVAFAAGTAWYLTLNLAPVLGVAWVVVLLLDPGRVEVRLAHMLRLRDETLKNELFPGVFEQLAAVSKSSGGSRSTRGSQTSRKKGLESLSTTPSIEHRWHGPKQTFPRYLVGEERERF